MLIICLLILTILCSVDAQCNGLPTIIMPNNNTGSLAFPVENLDPIEGTWRDTQLYPEGVSCTWILRAPPLHSFYMKILHFDTEENFDYVKLYSSESRTEELNHFSGSLKEPWETIIESDTLVIDFISDQFTNYNGFHLAYRYMPKACVSDGATIQENQLIAVPPWNLHGILPGPKRPGFEASVTGGIPLLNEISEMKSGPRWSEMSTYPQGLNCTWKVDVSPEQLLQIDVLKFKTDSDDVLQIWQLEASGLKPMLKFWNDQVSRSPIQTGFPLLLNFISGLEELGHGSGFLLNVSYIQRACKPGVEIFTSPHGLVGYPSHNLANGRWLTDNGIFYGVSSCRWRIIAPQSYSINITVVQFDTRAEDTLKITEGDTTLFSYGGPLPSKREISSLTNEVSVEFSSASESSQTGFLISYSWFLRDCQFKLSNKEGEVRSPYYPDAYGSGLQCQWKLDTPPGYIAQFLPFKIRLDAGDFLQITDGQSDVILSQESTNERLWEFAPSNPVVVNFVSNGDQNKGHFLLKYNLYQPGNCDFSLTSCGYQPADPLQAWDFKASEKMLFVDEANLGIHLPRGYRVKLYSPPIVPDSLLIPPGEVAQMCLKLSYQMSGLDAFLFTVSKEYLDDILSTEKINLLSVHGPQGNEILSESVNFTATKPFRLLISYERGYGPHYRLAITSTEVLHQSCFPSEEVSSLFSCNFLGSFCGWKNTHMDHKNWLLQKEGIIAKVDENSRHSLWNKENNKLQHQIADLTSPTVTLKDLVNESQADLCLDLSYEIKTFSADLKVVLVPTDENGSVNPLNLKRNKQVELWSQGRVRSQQTLAARIPLQVKTLPSKFKILLRAVSIKNNMPLGYHSEVPTSGIFVKNINLSPEKCPDLLNCDFSHGFCSWKVSSVGNTVWYIKNSLDDPVNNFAAIYSADRSEKVTEIISPFITKSSNLSLSFKYQMQKTTQCLRVGILETPDQKSEKLPVYNKNFVWEQCKGKGNLWLHECVDLPHRNNPYQVVFNSITGPPGSELWVDDVTITSGSCSQTKNVDKLTNVEEHLIWKCDPFNSLCGMTQPVIGQFDWVVHSTAQKGLHSPAIVYGPYENHQNSIHYENKESHMSDNGLPKDHIALHVDAELGESLDSYAKNSYRDMKKPTDFQCPDGRLLEAEWICDEIPDCDDNSDEVGCDCGSDGCGNAEDHDIPLGPHNCNEGSFLCPSGRICPSEGCPHNANPCLPRSHLCDGVAHCNAGEDETSCGGVIREDEVMDDYDGWQSDAPPADASKKIRSQLEEKKRFERSHPNGRSNHHKIVAMKDRFECSGGLLIPHSFKCDFVKDCPLDGLDEVGCHHCGPNDFVCPTSGICVPKSSVCDGSISVPTCTDEDMCNDCDPGQFACNVCLPSIKVCDGVWDCKEGEDELRCLGAPIHNAEGEMASQLEGHQHQDLVNTYSHLLPSIGCSGFMCLNERCIPIAAVCDRRIDCSESEDEVNCLDDNKEEAYSISAKISTEVKLTEDVPSYLITPVFQHAEGAVGVLSFKYRLDAWLGASNATLSVEILDANYSRTSLLPWAIWRQSGHKGTLWLKAQVQIPEIPTMRHYRMGFLLHSNGVVSSSQQIHLSDISYKMVTYETQAKTGLHLVTCEFVDSWCGWTQSYTERGYSWVHAMASPHGRRTGPITGYPDGANTGFIFADSLQGYEGDAADLFSPPLMLSDDLSSICLRFSVFLFGANIAKMSVHLIQVGSKGSGHHHPFDTELYSISGSQGLSWVLTSISINASHLEDPKEPFIVIIRATKGNGPEADIALDHFSILEGSCISDVRINPEILSKPAVNADYFSINSLKVGPSLTPYKVLSPLDVNSLNQTSENDFCNNISACSDCVSSLDEECLWCATTHTCVNKLSMTAIKCHSNSIVWNKLADKTKSGSSWCPRLTLIEGVVQHVAAESIISLTFPVSNVQTADMQGKWLCVFELDDSGVTEEMDILKQFYNVGDHAKEASLWNELRNYAFKKHQENLIVKVPGHFKSLGTFSSTDANADAATSEGIGTINCGNGEELFVIAKIPKLINATVKLQSPNGHYLDNVDDVHVMIYNCDGIGSDCQTCLSLNQTFSCGWCPSTSTCTTHSQCLNGLWHSHATSSQSYTCNVQNEFDFLKTLLEAEDQGAELGILEEELYGRDFDFGKKKKKKRVKNKMKKFLGNERQNNFEDEEEIGKTVNEDRETKKNKKKGSKEKGGNKDKGKIKMNKRGKAKGFLKVPVEPGVFVARDVWRLHTGKQYYVPVTKRTMINLGFVRQVTYGDLSKEKSRTVLMESSWKKAAGFYIDLFEKADQDPVTSIITTKKETFEKLLNQLQQS